MKLITLVFLLLASTAQAGNVKDYGAVCNRTNDDTVAIQSAITAAQSTQGTVEFPAGQPCFISGPLYVTGGLNITGEGRQTGGLIWTSKTLTALIINTDQMVNISKLQMLAPMDATAGGMISITGPNYNAFSTIKDSYFVGGYSQIVTYAAFAWIFDGNYHAQYVSTGVIVRNTYNADWGDSTIVNSTMSSGGVNATAIIQSSSGGLRILNNKLLGGQYAYRLWFGGNELTSDLLIQGNSIENQSVAALRFGTSNNGALMGNFVISNNQFMSQPIAIAMDDSHRFMTRIVISGNSISAVGTFGITLTNVDDFLVTGNQISGVLGAINGINIGSNSQNGRISGNTTRGFTTGISNGSTTTYVTN